MRIVNVLVFSKHAGKPYKAVNSMQNFITLNKIKLKRCQIIVLVVPVYDLYACGRSH